MAAHVTAQKTRSILVVDPDQETQGAIGNTAQDPRFPILFARSGKEAHDILADMEQPLSGVIINPKIEHPGGLTVIRYVHQFRPAVPIYLMHDSDGPILNEHELSLLGVHEAFPKPLTSERLARLLDPVVPVEHLPPDQSLSAAESVEEDQAFFPIRPNDFLLGKRSYFDLYCRLPSGKHVKIQNAGDDFSNERMGNYLKKGIHFFYIRKEAQEQYLGYCDQLASNLLRSSTAPLEAKVNQTILHGEETMRFLRTNGLKESQLNHANRFIQQIQDLLAQMNLKKHTVFKTFMNNLASVEHGTGTAIVASFVASSLKVLPSAHKLGIASLFHDIGLMGMPPEFQEEDETLFTADQLRLYRTHPTIGAQILSTTGTFDPLAIKAVAHHHWRLHGKGFSDESAGSQHSQMAELIGISDEFVRLIQKTKTHPEVQPLREMEKRVFDGFSTPVTEAFRNFFFLTLL